MGPKASPGGPGGLPLAFWRGHVWTRKIQGFDHREPQNTRFLRGSQAGNAAKPMVLRISRLGGLKGGPRMPKRTPTSLKKRPRRPRAAQSPPGSPPGGLPKAISSPPGTSWGPFGLVKTEVLTPGRPKTLGLAEVPRQKTQPNQGF